MLDLTYLKSRLEWLKNKPVEYEYEYTTDPATGYHIGPDCIRCGTKDCHPYFKGYCSEQCADIAYDEEDMLELVNEVERLRAAIQKHKDSTLANYKFQKLRDLELWSTINAES